jgi:hypothetical protein
MNTKSKRNLMQLLQKIVTLEQPWKTSNDQAK